MTLDELAALARGYAPARVVLSAVELDLFTLLEDGPLGPTELAARAGAGERGISAIAGALIALGLIRADADGKLHPADDTARALSRKNPEWRGAFLFHEDDLWKRFSELTACARTGAPSALPRDQKSIVATQLGAHHLKESLAPALAEALPLPGQGRVLDLGGGTATISAAILRRHPGATLTVLDRPLALDVARKVLPREWVKDGRVRLRAGNMLEDSLPLGFDLVLVSEVLRLFEPAMARRVLGKAREALVPGGALAIRDLWLDASREEAARAAALGAVELLVTTPGGRVYRKGEVEAWLAPAGLALERWLAPDGDPECETLIARRVD